MAAPDFASRPATSEVSKFEQETKKPGKCRGVIQKPESRVPTFPGFLLKHVLSGWGAAPLAPKRIGPVVENAEDINQQPADKKSASKGDQCTFKDVAVALPFRSRVQHSSDDERRTNEKKNQCPHGWNQQPLSQLFKIRQGSRLD